MPVEVQGRSTGCEGGSLVVGTYWKDCVGVLLSEVAVAKWCTLSKCQALHLNMSGCYSCRTRNSHWVSSE